MDGRDWLLVLIAVLLWACGVGFGYLLRHRKPEPEVWVDASVTTFGRGDGSPHLSGPWITLAASTGGHVDAPQVLPNQKLHGYNGWPGDRVGT